MEEAKEHPQRVAWGTGRVMVRANLRAIHDLLNEGWPLTTVYQRLKGSLGGVSYRQFAEHVRRQLRATSKQPATKQGALTQSNGSAQSSIAESSAQRGAANEQKSKVSGEPPKFRPGPRIPDPRDLY